MSDRSLEDYLDDDSSHHPPSPGSVGSEEAGQILDQSFLLSSPGVLQHQAQESDLGFDLSAPSAVSTPLHDGSSAPSLSAVDTASKNNR